MVFCFVGGKWLFGRASGECACLRAGLDYLLRVTVCNTFPFLSIMRSSSVSRLRSSIHAECGSVIVPIVLRIARIGSIAALAPVTPPATRSLWPPAYLVSE